jgi:hypothetical protein
VHRIFFSSPGRRFHFVEARAHDHFHFVAAEDGATTGRQSIARVALTTEHDHALADRGDGVRTTPTTAIDADVDVRRGLPCGRAGRDRGLAARRCPTNTASQPPSSSARMLSMRCPARNSMPMLQHVAHFLVDDRIGQAELGICVRIMPPALASPSNTTHS